MFFLSSYARVLETDIHTHVHALIRTRTHTLTQLHRVQPFSNTSLSLFEKRKAKSFFFLKSWPWLESAKFRRKMMNGNLPHCYAGYIIVNAFLRLITLIQIEKALPLFGRILWNSILFTNIYENFVYQEKVFFPQWQRNLQQDVLYDCWLCLPAWKKGVLIEGKLLFFFSFSINSSWFQLMDRWKISPTFRTYHLASFSSLRSAVYSSTWSGANEFQDPYFPRGCL